jgi:uncharacterized protein YbjT (DUF2867 family)
LGTTIRKAGSQQAFRRVDFDYVLAFAEWAQRDGADQFAVVSSVGASAESGNFYLRVKGEMEGAVSACGYRAVHIFQPGVLLGERSESRPVESILSPVARALRFALVGSLRKYRPIEASTVASAMIAAAHLRYPGMHVYRFDEIVQLSEITQPLESTGSA